MRNPSGRDPTPETIRQGTVRMEEHPQYAQMLAEIETRGCKVVFAEDDPCVVVREVVNAQGATLRIEREMQIRPGMAYLDLEHETGHLDQIETRLRDAMLPTKRVLESGRPFPNTQGLYPKWQNDISEYHNRLIEYKRLYERGIARDILEEHAQGVRIWRERYAKMVREKRYGSLEATSRIEWGQKYFPNIGELAIAYSESGGENLERDRRP